MCPEKEETAQQEAFKVETEAFETSATRVPAARLPASYQNQSDNSQEEYDRTCSISARSASTPEAEPATPLQIRPPPSSPGLTIGPYTACTMVDDGVTSIVYYSPTSTLTALPSDTGYALKVVHTHPPEPHNPRREIKTLQSLIHAGVIPLLEAFRNSDGEDVLVFPYKPLTLARLLDAGGPVSTPRVRSIARDVLSGLAYIHERGIIHRDLKPSAILLDGPDGPACISDFGTVWHPEYSTSSEPAGPSLLFPLSSFPPSRGILTQNKDSKILDIGTGPYRPPDALLGNKSYSTPTDIWSLGVLLSSLASTSTTPTPIFTSPPTHEDGSQLGLILSIFRTLGTPTPETWPEAASFRTSPFGMWRVFEGQGDAFEGVRGEFRGLVGGMLRYESGERLTAKQVRSRSTMDFFLFTPVYLIVPLPRGPC